MRSVRLIVPDAGPINTLAAAHHLSLLLAPPQIRLTLLRSIVDEILVRSDDLAAFMATHADRIDVIETSVCRDNAARRCRGEVLGKGRGDLAIADFLLNEIDRVTEEMPSLLITEDRKLLGRLSSQEAFRNVRFMTPVAYLRALERKGVIDSFQNVWRAIVDANVDRDPAIHRSPNDEDVDLQSDPDCALFEDEDVCRPSSL